MRRISEDYKVAWNIGDAKPVLWDSTTQSQQVGPETVKNCKKLQDVHWLDYFGSESKKPAVRRVSLIGTWQCPTLTWGNPTLPSALIRFTSEFGMGSGGTVSLWLPRNLVTIWESLILIQSVSNYFLLCLAFSLSLLTTPTSLRSLLGVVWLSLSGN